MNRILFISFALILSVFLACGQSKKQELSAASETKTDTIKVPTIQCGTCRMNIEEALNSLDGFKAAKVDLKAKVVTVQYFAAKLDLGKIETAITKAGYAANDKKADPAAYEKLDDCCKLPEDQE